MPAVYGIILLLYAVIAIAVLILMIARYKVYPFLVLMIVSVLLAPWRSACRWTRS